MGNPPRVAHILIYARITSDMALAYTDLTKGVLFIMDGAPYEVLETHFLRMQQRKAVVQTASAILLPASF